MNTHTITEKETMDHLEQHLPSTSRGRALYTIDWFLNGKPELNQHDNPLLGITSVSRN